MGLAIFEDGSVATEKTKMDPDYPFSLDGEVGGWRFMRRANGDWRSMRPAADFANQAFEDIIKNLGSGQKWKDPNPPPLPADAKNVTYRDPEEAGENGGGGDDKKKASCLLFKPPPGRDNPTDPNDIQQGALGDCWFMAASSTVAAYQELDDRWLGRYDEDKGVYEFIFYEENDFSERRVCVDRQVPLLAYPALGPGEHYTDGHPGNIRYYFCRSMTPGELWSSLLEKAFAKLYGGYANIDGGSSSIGIANLTRGVPFDFTYGGDGLPSDPDILWARLVQLWNDGWVLGISFKKGPEGCGAGGPCGEPAGHFGLISGHAYGVLGLYKSQSTGLRFLKIRNPHATNEWQGEARPKPLSSFLLSVLRLLVLIFRS